MERNIKHGSQKESVVKVVEKPLVPKEVNIKEQMDLPAEKELSNPLGPGGRVLRGPFGAY